MGDSTVDAWEDLSVGDRVRVFVSGAQNLLPDIFDVVELRLTEDVLAPGAREAVAVIRGGNGEVLTVSARMVRKIAM